VSLDAAPHPFERPIQGRAEYGQGRRASPEDLFAVEDKSWRSMKEETALRLTSSYRFGRDCEHDLSVRLFSNVLEVLTPEQRATPYAYRPIAEMLAEYEKPVLTAAQVEGYKLIGVAARQKNQRRRQRAGLLRWFFCIGEIDREEFRRLNKEMRADWYADR